MKRGDKKKGMKFDSASVESFEIAMSFIMMKFIWLGYQILNIVTML